MDLRKTEVKLQYEDCFRARGMLESEVLTAEEDRDPLDMGIQTFHYHGLKLFLEF